MKVQWQTILAASVAGRQRVVMFAILEPLEGVAWAVVPGDCRVRAFADGICHGGHLWAWHVWVAGGAGAGRPGLAMFGIGMAVIYTGACCYYAMEVGRSEVQAGGKHAGVDRGRVYGGAADWADAASLASCELGLDRPESV